MADVTQMEPISPKIPPMNGTEPPKRPRGRPRKETKAAPVVEEAEPTEETYDNADFWLRLSNYSVEEWNHLIAYLYRVAPKIDRKSGGKPSNLCTFSTAFTRDEIMREHGSGVYRIDLCYQDPTSSKSHRIARDVFTIMNVKFPPIVPDGDWVEDKCNDMWKWGASTMSTSTGPGGGLYPPGFNVADMMDKADERALKMVEIMTPKGNSALDTVLAQMVQMNSPERLIALVQAIAPKPPDTSATDKLFTLMNDQLKETRAELRAIREKEAVPQKTLLEQISEVRELGKALGGGRSSGSTDGWIALAEKALESVPDVLDLVKSGMNKPAPAEAPTNGLAAAPAATPPAAKEAAAELTDEQKARAFIDERWKKWGHHLMGIAPKLVEDFTTATGYDFRDWYLHMHGELKWRELRRDLATTIKDGAEITSPALLINMYMAQPKLREDLAPPEKLFLFLREFLCVPGEEPAGDVVPDPVDDEDPQRGAMAGEAKNKGMMN